MKKLVAFLLALIMLLSLAQTVPIANADAPHTHKWTKVEGVNPTCTIDGWAYYYCSGCGEYRDESLPALGHDWATKVYTSYADCTHYGVFYWVCARCGAHSATGNDKPLGHDWGEWKIIKYPTPEENGLMERECQRCGITEQKTITMDDIPNSGLRIEAWVVYDTEYEIGEMGNFIVKFINTSDAPTLLTGIDLSFADGSEDTIDFNAASPLILASGESTTVNAAYWMNADNKAHDDDDYIDIDVTGRGKPNGKNDEIQSNTVSITFRLKTEEDPEEKPDLLLGVSPRVNGMNTSTVKVGDTVYFDYSLTNNTENELEIANIREWYGEANIDNADPFSGNYLKAGETRTSSASGAKELIPYVVKLEDFVGGKLKINFFAVGRDYIDHPSNVLYDLAYTNSVVIELTLENYKPSFSLQAELIDYPPFKLDQDYASINVIIENTSDKDFIVTRLYHYSDNATAYTIDHPFGDLVFKPNDVHNLTVSYLVSSADLWHSDEDIVITFGAEAAVVDSESEMPIYSNEDDVDIPWYEDPNLVLYKYTEGHEYDGYVYSAGDPVVYKIFIHNTSKDRPIYCATIYDEPEGHERVTVASFDEIAPLQSNEGEEIIYTYYLTQQDIDDAVQLSDGKYYFRNNVYASYYVNAGKSGDLTWRDDYCYVPVDKYDKSDVEIIKTEISHYDESKGYYGAGEEIKYTITVVNNSDHPIHILGIYDSYDSDAVAADIILHATESYSADYKITVTEYEVSWFPSIYNQAWVKYEEDVDGEQKEDLRYSNIVESPIGPKPEEHTEGDSEAPTVIKTAENMPKNGSYYQKDELIHYVFSITNNSDETLFDTKITDEMKGKNEDADIWIGDVLPHETAMGDFYYTVKAEDCVGFLYNEGSMSYTSADGESHVIYPIPCTVETEIIDPVPEAPNVVLVKSAPFAPKDGPFFVENESIEYWIDASNLSDDPIYDLEIYDDLFDVNAPLVTVPYLAPWSSTITYKFCHMVTKEEAESETGSLNNQAYAYFHTEEEFAGNTPEKVYSNALSVPVGVPEKPTFDPESVYMTKEVLNSPLYGDAFTYNEAIYFLITIYNNSDYPVSVSSVYDFYWGSDFGSNNYLPGGFIPPHSVLPIPYSHVVTWAEANSSGHFLTNAANASVIVNFEDKEEQYDLVCSPVTVKLDYIPDPPVVPGDPVVFKKVLGDPAKVYKEGEDIWFILFLYNTSGSTIYDIAVYDQLVPGFYLDGFSLLGDGEVYSKAFNYSVTKFDAEVIGSVTNIGWFTLSMPTRNTPTTFYTNEVTVACGKDPEPPRTPSSHPDSCKVTLVGKGEGAWEYMTVFCAEHNSVKAGFRKLLDACETDADRTVAYQVGLDMWTRALEREYEKLIKNAPSEEIAFALNNDSAVFGGYLKSVRNRLSDAGLDENEINARIIRLITDRVTELCYTFGDGKDERRDILTDKVPEINRVEANACSAVYDNALSGSYTVTFNVCNGHIMLLRTIDRTLAATQNDPELKAAGWIRAKSYWQAKLTTDYDTLANQAGAGVYALSERAAFLAMVKTHGALYTAVYGDEALTEELTTTMMLKRALELDAR